MTPLDEYRRKRDPTRTPEPMGGAPAASGSRFVIHRHESRRLHYDLRLELDGTLASWALPKGMPLEVGGRLLAVHVEDHPLLYLEFSGVIPKGEYGAGVMEIWDRGEYELVERKRDGGLSIRLRGARLDGLWTLVPARLDGDERNWLVIRKRDDSRGAGHVRLAPMLATAAQRLPARGRWLYEVKWDGYRALGVLTAGEARLVGRSGGDLGDRFPAVVKSLPRALRTTDCVVDGEVCALDERGRADFGLLQSGAGSLVYYVFDLLELEQAALTALPLSERRQRLTGLLTGRDPVVRLSTVFEDGAALMAAAREHDLEGVVAKRADSRYLPGRRSGSWIKVKSRRQDEFLIAGHTAGTGSRERLGALVLAERDNSGELRWAGNVGSGLDEAEITRLLGDLAPLASDNSPFSATPRIPRVCWAEPRLRCRVAYAERTREGRLRAPVYLGRGSRRRVAAGSGRVQPTNADKVFFPSEGITKGDLFAYYQAVAPVLVPHLRDRPFTMLRRPDGIDGKSFFQKDAPDHMPAWIRRFRHEGISYALVNDADALLWMVNMGCIDLHPWLARRDRPDRPDLVMFDLDPAEGTSYATVVEVALLVRQALRALGLDGVPKTSGGNGLHVLVGVQRRHSHADARAFVAAVARALARTHPELITTRWRRAERHGVLIDANQNGLGRTTASVYSVRPRAGAPVSTPLAWDELDDRLDPRAFTMEAVLERVSRLGDLAQPLLHRRGRLP